MQSRAFKKGGKGFGSTYPPSLNVYRLGMWTTTFVGTTRMASLVIFVLGTFFYFPAQLYGFFYPTDDPKEAVPWWLPPLLLLGSPLPLIAAFFAFGPWIHQVYLHLPSPARQSRKAFMQFAGNLPPQSKLSLQFIGFKPWPKTVDVRLYELRRLPVSPSRLANLEHHSDKHNTDLDMVPQRLQGFMERYMKLYFVKHQARDKTTVPGVWEQIWEQIPKAGDGKGPVAPGREQGERSMRKPHAPRLMPVQPKD